MKRLSDYLVKLVMSKFYGTVTIRFEAGVVVHVKEEKSYPKQYFE